MTDAPNVDDLTAAVRDELECLWGDLAMAQLSAINTEWSIQCNGLAERIKNLTMLVGPTPWEKVSITLLENGVYQRLHGEMNVPVEVDMGEVAAVRGRIEARSADRDRWRARNWGGAE